MRTQRPFPARLGVRPRVWWLCTAAVVAGAFSLSLGDAVLAKGADAVEGAAPGGGYLLVAAAEEEAEKQIEIDLDSPPKTTHELAPGLTFGANLEIDFEMEKNYDLNSNDDDDLSTLEPEFSVALTYEPTPKFRAFLDVDLSKRFQINGPPGIGSRSTKLEIDLANVVIRDLVEGMSLQIGRQRFDDDREWLYDENLDGARMFYRSAGFALELSASRRLILGKDLLNDNRRGDINNFFLLARYTFAEDSEVGAYALYQDDRGDRRAEDLAFFGLRSSGEITKDLEYWAELAHVRGDFRSNNVRGYGLDLGATQTFDLSLEPSVTLGAAFGSGDSDPNDNEDRDFRQTGLQDNNDKFNGITGFKYYGEVFDPELSNMGILTLGAGVRPTKKSSIDLVYHRYWQHHTSDDLRDVDIDEDPEGFNRDLGQEIDLVIGFREIENMAMELVLGGFFPGDAFANDVNNAYFAGFEAQYRF